MQHGKNKCANRPQVDIAMGKQIHLPSAPIRHPFHGFRSRLQFPRQEEQMAAARRSAMAGSSLGLGEQVHGGFCAALRVAMSPRLECAAYHSLCELPLCCGDGQHYGQCANVVETRLGRPIVGAGARGHGEKALREIVERTCALRQRQKPYQWRHDQTPSSGRSFKNRADVWRNASVTWHNISAARNRCDS